MLHMNLSIARRSFFGATAAATFATTLRADLPPSFPSHPPTLIREMVASAHGRAARVRDLLGQRPTLANAAWDWGFGDWETALGAASHVGNREIAELLLANGAHPTLFSATMLGQLDVVKAMIAARPGVERTLGPHSIGLLAHARAGGAQSASVLRFLEELGGNSGLTAVEISEEELSKLTGEFAFGAGPDDRILIEQKGKQLMLTRKGMDARPLYHRGDRLFRPAGAPGVRIDFSDANVVTIHDGDVVLKATRR
jgi:hypothetical protein